VATDNIIFNLAAEFIRHTTLPLFLTGKAGTGKTTFLRHIKETTKKNTVIVAPTGVAAIHAGGTTIHSFFQLPFTPFIPEIQKGSERSADMSDKYSLLKNLKIESEKRNLFRALELLIIDEVSMVRCDVLDAMDTILRHFRRRPFIPFGGVQVLFIGDLFQLPPVVPDDQWVINYYDGPFFFHAKVLEQSRPLYLELKKIYRQTDSRFIKILNNIRNNEVDEEDLIMLNERYIPAFEPPLDEHYITLTTHNHKADSINASALARLSTPLFCFEGEIEGDFPERNFPTDKVLNLKEGAQVMFIKNDMEKVRRYYNGKIGKIKRIQKDRIVVVFPNESADLTVEKDTWNNIRYTVDPNSHQVEEEVLGTFTQYAIRLAWAVTIHKSQGLTFERAIVDAGKSFAPGQVYVALSRCTSLQGVVLCSRIFRNSIMTDERVIRFAEEESSPEELTPILEESRHENVINRLLDIFDLTSAVDEMESFQHSLEMRKFQDKKAAAELILSLVNLINSRHHTAQKFQQQLRTLFNDLATPEDRDFLRSRVEAGSQYFSEQLETTFIGPLRKHQENLKGKKGIKAYRKDLKQLIELLRNQLERIQKSVDIVRELWGTVSAS
jgi:PIF1-like helicase/Helicase